MRRSPLPFLGAFVAAIAATAACSSSATPEGSGTGDAGFVPLGDGGFVDAPEQSREKPKTDGGFVGPDGSVIREDRFVSNVVSFTPGACAGFGASEMPAIVLGPPVGAGDTRGGLDVVSLGIGGEIVVGFGDNEIVDQPGPDFIVFENAFFAAGDPSIPAADLAEVSVSSDGVTWKTFPCAPGPSAPYGACAGWRPVYSAPDNGVSPVEVGRAGGDPYDLGDLGLASAKLVRIRDLSTLTCDGMPKPVNLGFDLDAVAIVHAKKP
ncbi:MAG: hypothetical protein JST00_30005 [Deltaproteobacteria bacterium]|nr:hypothetical protein [Deltaproteobacteria bacterium]